MNAKKYFVLKLIPPRPTFTEDMNDAERAIMQKHVAYWMDMMSKRVVIVFGPVIDPKGSYGIGIVEVDSDDQLNSFTTNDPATKLCKYEIYLMARAVVRP